MQDKTKEEQSRRKKEQGQRMQRLREAAGLSQSDLSKAARVPMGTVRNLEHGRRMPRLDTALALARAVGVTLDQFSGHAPAPVESTTRTHAQDLLAEAREIAVEAEKAVALVAELLKRIRQTLRAIEKASK